MRRARSLTRPTAESRPGSGDRRVVHVERVFLIRLDTLPVAVALDSTTDGADRLEAVFRSRSPCSGDDGGQRSRERPRKNCADHHCRVRRRRREHPHLQHAAACSGAMKPGVPATTGSVLRRSSSAATPQSMTSTSPNDPSMTFSGFKSPRRSHVRVQTTRHRRCAAPVRAARPPRLLA